MGPVQSQPTSMHAIRDLVAARASKNDAAALSDVDGHSLSFTDLLRLIDRAAADLSSAGLAGRTVATVVRNGPIAAASFLGVSAAGACAPLNPALKRRQAADLIRSVDAAAVVLEHGVAGEWAQAAADAGVAVIGLRQEDPAGAFRLDLPADLRVSGIGEAGRREALLLTTSGTTAAPKVVGLSHEGLLWTSSVIAAGLELAPADVAFNVMPLFHIHGLVACLLAPLAAGATVVCAPGFDPGHSAGWIRRAGATYISCVPTVHQALLRTAAASPIGKWAGSLRLLRSCSAPLDPTTWTRLADTFSVPVVQAYAMTEASHQIASVPLREAGPGWVGTVGLPDAAEVKVLTDSGHEAGRDEEGEIVIRGRGVIAGYLAPSSANESSFVDGWLRTGDRGSLDSLGKLRLTGRSKEFINRGGTKISPYQIEAEILAYPGVRECAVYPVPHPTLGEDLGVAVVAEGKGFEAARLREFLQARLPEDRIPHAVKLVPVLPLGPTGKVQRLSLASQLDTVAGANGTGGRAEVVVDAVRRILGRPDLRPTDDIFAAGGDSIALAELAAWLADTCGLDLDGTELLDRGTTLAAIAEVVNLRTTGSTSRDRVASRLTVFQPGRPGNLPLVCVLAHTGQAVLARRLAERLPGELPVLGLLPSSSHMDDLEGLKAAVRWCQRQLELSHVDEFDLFGMCLGATLALEITRSQQGVRNLALLDPFAIRPGASSRIAFHLATARLTGLWPHLAGRVRRRLRLIGASVGVGELDQTDANLDHAKLVDGPHINVPTALLWSRPYEAADRRASVRWASVVRPIVTSRLNATHEMVYSDRIVEQVAQSVLHLIRRSEDSPAR